MRRKARDVLGWKPQVGFEELVRMMVEADLAEQARPRGSMTRAFITGISGQDGSYLAEQLLAEGVEVHALAHAEEPLPDLPGVGCTRRPHRLRRRPRGSCSTSPRTRSTTSPRSARWLARGRSPISRLGSTASQRSALLESAWQVQEQHRPAGRLRAGLERGDLRQPRSSPQDETTPLRPINPYGAAKAYAHQLVEVYRAT